MEEKKEEKFKTNIYKINKYSEIDNKYIKINAISYTDIKTYF